MNGPTLQVQMLGQFTLRYGDRTISDSDDRSRRVWSLLAYMLYNHGRSFAQEELIHLYWSNSEKSADPGNALKSIFHRIRTALDKLQPGLGRLLIRRKAGRYFWNNVMPLSLDIEDFEAHFHGYLYIFYSSDYSIWFFCELCLISFIVISNTFIINLNIFCYAITNIFAYLLRLYLSIKQIFQGLCCKILLL